MNIDIKGLILNVIAGVLMMVVTGIISEKLSNSNIESSVGRLILKGIYFLIGFLMIIMGYFLSIVAAVIGIIGVIIGISNMSHGFPGLMFGQGCGFILLGLATPIFYGTNSMRYKFFETLRAI